MCTSLPRLPRLSFTSVFTGINIVISAFFLISYLDLLPEFSSDVTFVRNVPIRISPVHNDSVSFKDIILKFRFCHFPEAIADVCARGNLTLLIVVQSSPTSVNIRNVIRATWANKKDIPSLKSDSARVVFLIGNGDSASREVQNEMALHQDIITVDTEDSYKNLVFKTALTLHMSNEHCPTPFLLKIDEDVVFNIERFMSGVSTNFRENSSSIYCKMWRGSVPSRDKANAWFVSEHQYRGRKFPDYCAGPSYVLTAPAVAALLETIPDFNLITVEDVFVTGIVAQKAGVKRVGMPSKFKSDYKVLNYTATACPGELMSIHNLKTEREIRETWSYLSRNC